MTSHEKRSQLLISLSPRAFTGRQYTRASRFRLNYIEVKILVLLITLYQPMMATSVMVCHKPIRINVEVLILGVILSTWLLFL